MLMRLAYKELRETAWIAAAALALYVYYVADITGAGRGNEEQWQSFHFILDNSNPDTWLFVGMALAAGLGLRQTVGESARGTFQFLLHRPASRSQVIGTKLAIGMGLYLVTAIVPILLIGWWALTPGNLPAPFAWSMLADPWKAWPVLTIVYLSAFLAGLRPARWLGTRLLPLAAGIMLAIILVFLPIPYWCVIGLLAVVVLDVLLVANILYVARTRDFS